MCGPRSRGAAFQHLVKHGEIGAGAAARVDARDGNDDRRLGNGRSGGSRRRRDVSGYCDGIERSLFVDQLAENPHRLAVNAAHLPPVAGVVFADDIELGAGGKLGHLVVAEPGPERARTGSPGTIAMGTGVAVGVGGSGVGGSAVGGSG